jgi:hypothetical protein
MTESKFNNSEVEKVTRYLQEHLNNNKIDCNSAYSNAQFFYTPFV